MYYLSTTRRRFLGGAAILAAWPTNLLGAGGNGMPPLPGMNPQGDSSQGATKATGAPGDSPWETADGNATDSVMARRLYLDLAGRIPTAKEAWNYVDSKLPHKREALVDWLLATPEFADFWSMRFCDILRVKSEFPINLWPNAVYVYHARIRAFVEKNEPWDVFGRALLTARGSDFRDAEANFFRATDRRNPEGWAEAVAQTFLGIPPDRLDPQRRRQMAAFFTSVRIKDTREWKEEIVYTDGPDRRGKFCDQLFGADRDEVATAFRRRIRGWIFGPQAPDVPGKAEFRLKHLLRRIVLSPEYARGSVTGGFPARRIEAETLDDAIRTLSGDRRNLQSPAPEPFTFLPPKRATVCVEDGSISNSFLTLFGRPARDTGLPEERGTAVTAKQRLYLFNSGALHKQLGSIVGLPNKKNAPDPRTFRERVVDLYWKLLAREPSAGEMQAIMALWRQRGGGNPKRRPRPRPFSTLHDVAWCLVNTKEFLFRV